VIRGIAFDLFDTLVDQNHDRLSPIDVDGRRVGATTPALHAFAIEDAGRSLSLAEFAAVLEEVDRELRVDTIDVNIELASLDRFAVLASRLECSDVLSVAKAMAEIHMGILHGAVTVPPHHEAVLASLAVDYSLALCSNFSHAPTAHRILREAGFDRHLETVVISDEVGIRKPRREIFDQVRDSLGFAAHEILHVGDKLRADVGGAAAIGMRTVWLTRCVRDPETLLEQFDGPRPDFAIEDLMDLPVLVARLGGS
jgi:FMN phosphatase YigB (HAD superfamily)